VTGSDGYLGSLLAVELLRAGHDVMGLDTGFYKEGTLYRHGPFAPFTLVKDLRQIEPADFRGIDAVVHMAELSNDPIRATRAEHHLRNQPCRIGAAG